MFATGETRGSTIEGCGCVIASSVASCNSMCGSCGLAGRMGSLAGSANSAISSLPIGISIATAVSGGGSDWLTGMARDGSGLASRLPGACRWRFASKTSLHWPQRTQPSETKPSGATKVGHDLETGRAGRASGNQAHLRAIVENRQLIYTVAVISIQPSSRSATARLQYGA